RRGVRPDYPEPFQVLDRRAAMMGARIVYLGGTRREMEVHPPIVCPGPALEGAQHRLAAPLDAEWLDRGAHPFGVPARPETLHISERRVRRLAKVWRDGVAIHRAADHDGAEAGFAEPL